LSPDDESTVRELICEVLAQSGYRTLSTSSGREGLDLATRHQPSLIVVDVMMPAMDGYATVARLRDDSETARIRSLSSPVRRARRTGSCLRPGGLPPGGSGCTQTGEANLSYAHPTLGRFRVKRYRRLGVTGGLQNALRQAPDGIFVGDVRDAETVAVARHSAETGTLHATNATSAPERLCHFFHPDARPATLLQLSLLGRAVIAPRLVPRAEGTGRIAALEVMLLTPRIQALIAAGSARRSRRVRTKGSRPSTRPFSPGTSGTGSRRATPSASPTAPRTCDSGCQASASPKFPLVADVSPRLPARFAREAVAVLTTRAATRRAIRRLAAGAA
jgi:hypothetical protein